MTLIEPCSVAQLNRYISTMFRRDPRLAGCCVRGEVSNFRPHYSGHMYFTLKDESSQIRCVMFKTAAFGLRFSLENGMKVVADGSVGVYERDGQYQLVCERLTADGAGSLAIAFENLKRKLESEGLFASDRKRRPPMIPSSVCVITSPTGAVVHDIINVATRRYPRAVIKIWPVKVQGAGAAEEIARAITAVSEARLADTVIVGRGGGSLEELWAFNEEVVARAAYHSKIPIISAVGHETDFTICDFVADLRAPTPSAAAELAFPDYQALVARVSGCEKAVKLALGKRLERASARLARLLRGAALTKPLSRINGLRVRLAYAEEKLINGARRQTDARRAALSPLAAKLDALSPLAALSRGYSVTVSHESGKAIKRASEATAGQEIRTLLASGSLLSRIVRVIDEPRVTRAFSGDE